MGRANSQKSSGNKNSLPQIPKNLKIEPNRVDEEFSRELGEGRKIRATRPQWNNKLLHFESDCSISDAVHQK